MIRTLLTLAFAAATGAAGYIGGSVYPAPQQWVDAIDRQAGDVRARLKLEKVDLAGLQGLVSSEKLSQIEGEITRASVAAGHFIEVDREPISAEQMQSAAMIESLPAPMPVSFTPAAPITPKILAPGAKGPAPVAPGPTAPVPKAGAFDAALLLCPRMEIRNAPAANAQLQVANFNPLVAINGVKLAADPAPGACLSSGFGERGSELHKGVDFHNEAGGPILAAGDGQIVEMKYRDDYGNMIIIDHGQGVYTRYAHLASFEKGLSNGVRVQAGDQIGLMGNTAGYPVPIHLHYEVLVGDYNTPKASFGLAPKDVFGLAAAK